MVGGRDYKKSKFNRVTQAMRQPGSLFKPIVFSLALIRGKRWSDIVYVSPLTFGRSYRPRTTKKDYITETTMLRSFYRSMNSPTLQIGKDLGLSRVLKHAKILGIRTPIKEEIGSILGSSNSTMMEMNRLYGILQTTAPVTNIQLFSA